MWVKVEDKLPEVDQEVIYYFDICGVFRGEYQGLEEGLPCFTGASGWLTGDVTHWQPDRAGSLPDAPKKYTIRVEVVGVDIFHEAFVVTVDEFPTIKEFGYNLMPVLDAVIDKINYEPLQKPTL